MFKGPRTYWVTAAVIGLLLVLAAELLLSIRQESQTFDETAHLYAGLSYWKHGDFGVNPEHPPLVKLVAALPVLPLAGQLPPAPNIPFRAASVAGGVQFLYSHDADAVLFRARVAAAVFTLSLALLIFAAGREMFGLGAALFGLTLFAFEPNVLANGALVTTDMGGACLLFAAIYAFYRYVKWPSAPRLLACGVVTGLALAAKHSALVVFPILLFLSVVELIRRNRPLPVARLAGSLALIAAVSVTILWAFYAFRYAARPDNQQIVPPTAASLKRLKNPTEISVIGSLERYHLLPESYLYGLTDVAAISQTGRPAFLFGKLYPTGRWFYFPAAFAIKSTLGFLLLLTLLIPAKQIWRVQFRREVLFLAIPVVIFFSMAMFSKLDIGIRHIFPVYPFLIALAAAAAWSVSTRSRGWMCVAGILLAFHAASSLKAFPNYLPYSNEIWGGPSQTHKVLADSNVGWAGGLKSLHQYLDSHHVTQCWFAYDGPAIPAYYHIGCSPLPTFFWSILHRPQPMVPEQIQGPVFLSAATLTGFDWGPGNMNPYTQFRELRPVTVLQGEILVFDGSFHVPEIAAMTHLAEANRLLKARQRDAALAEAMTAVQLNPELRDAHELLASIYASRG